MQVRYSAAAEADLFSIGAYTLQTWGEAQASHYLSSLEDCCERLARNPMLGRACDEIRPGLRRMPEGRHVIFYQRKVRGIFVVRILHAGMLPEEQFAESEPHSH